MILKRRLSDQKADVASGLIKRPFMVGPSHFRRADWRTSGGSIGARPVRRPSLPVGHGRKPEGDLGEADDQGQVEELEVHGLTPSVFSGFRPLRGAPWTSGKEPAWLCFTKVRLIQAPYDTALYETRMGQGPGRFLRHGAAERLEALGHEVALGTVDPRPEMLAEVATSFADMRGVADEVRTARESNAFPLVLARTPAFGSETPRPAGMTRTGKRSQLRTLERALVQSSINLPFMWR